MSPPTPNTTKPQAGLDGYSCFGQTRRLDDWDGVRLKMTGRTAGLAVLPAVVDLYGLPVPR